MFAQLIEGAASGNFSVHRIVNLGRIAIPDNSEGSLDIAGSKRAAILAMAIYSFTALLEDLAGSVGNSLGYFENSGIHWGILENLVDHTNFDWAAVLENYHSFKYSVKY